MPEPILFYSTNHKSSPVTFPQALLKGIAPDGPLMPERIPVIDKASRRNIKNSPIMR